MIWLLPIGGLLLIAAYHFGRAAPRRTSQSALASAVTQQHLHLFQGGQLNPTAVEAAKLNLRNLLVCGEIERAEAHLRPGLDYAVQVQALAEIGGRQAAEILHRQLRCRASDDSVEQSWYWIDLAQGLRRVNRADSLSHLLRCPASGGDVPLAQYFAAETACCPGFVEALHRPYDVLGCAAVRVLHSILRGLRHGVSPHVVGDARLGEAIAALWRHRPDRTDPRVVCVLIEALRMLQRTEHIRHALHDHPAAVVSFERQTDELAQCADAFSDYLSDAPGPLLDDLAAANEDARADIFRALEDLRVDAASVVVANLREWSDAHRELGVRLLRWSGSAEVGPWLCEWAEGAVNPLGRAARTARATPPNRPSIPPGFPYAALLYALRGQPDSEWFLLVAASDWDPTFRAAAVSSLGWWEPRNGLDVHRKLQSARDDANADVRRAAEAALARLGERRALQSIRAALAGETDAAITDTVRFIGSERLLWLWPDLDALADSGEMTVTLAVREALEQMREELAGGLLVR